MAMTAFAGNSLLCRGALAAAAIDPATFTGIRLASGALVLALLARGRARAGSVPSAFALFAYAAAFSFAYVRLSAGVGALLLFGAVQATMIGAGLRAGEPLTRARFAGFVLAATGLVVLVRPGLDAPDPLAALAMIAAGAAWGVYSLRGRGARDPLGETAGNFLRAAPFGLALVAVQALVPASGGGLHAGARGATLAAVSGALASGLGYAIWYAALPRLSATVAGIVQSSVPILAALGGVLLLGEPVTARLVFAALVVPGGIALAILGAPVRHSPAEPSRRA